MAKRLSKKYSQVSDYLVDCGVEITPEELHQLEEKAPEVTEYYDDLIIQDGNPINDEHVKIVELAEKYLKGFNHSWGEELPDGRIKIKVASKPEYQEVLEEFGLSSLYDLDIPKLFNNLVKIDGGFDIEHLYELARNNPELLRLYPKAIKGNKKELKIINDEIVKYKNKVGKYNIDLKFYNEYMNKKAGIKVSYSDFIKKLKQNRDALEIVVGINGLTKDLGQIEVPEVDYWFRNLASYFRDFEKKKLSDSDERILLRRAYGKLIDMGMELKDVHEFLELKGKYPESVEYLLLLGDKDRKNGMSDIDLYDRIAEIFAGNPMRNNITKQPEKPKETKQPEKPKVKMKRINVGYISVKDDLSWEDVIIAGKKIGGKVRKDPKIYRNSDGEGLLLPIDEYKLSFKMFSEEPILNGRYVESIRFQICEINKSALTLKQAELKELGEEILNKLAKQLKGKFTKI